MKELMLSYWTSIGARPDATGGALQGAADGDLILVDGNHHIAMAIGDNLPATRLLTQRYIFLGHAPDVLALLGIDGALYWARPGWWIGVTITVLSSYAGSDT